MPRYQIRTVRTQEQWVEVDAEDAVQAQQLARQAEWTDIPATVQCYAVRLTTDLTDKEE